MRMQARCLTLPMIHKTKSLKMNGLAGNHSKQFHHLSNFGQTKSAVDQSA